ncbi:MAG: DNA replication/repair protein RecF [Clostridia bacterium]|nr:DNA replication/repair protein RecF [Clostridia bacterium]
MIVKEIGTVYFRNLHTQKVLFDEGLNIICGDNGQGKTNLLEAVYLCCIGKSPRTERDADMINNRQPQAKVRLLYNGRYGDGEIEIILDGKTKQISVNNVPLKRTGDLMGYFNAVYFSPDELKLVKASPQERRRYMDIALSQTDKLYFYSLSGYNKTLQQRNNLLRRGGCSAALLSPWDEILAREGARIHQRRRIFIEKLKPVCAQIHANLSDDRESLDVEYESRLEGASLAEVEGGFLKQLASAVEKDIQNGFTSVGIQRDDIKISINGVDLRRFGSQGQQRTCALSLKIGETEFIKEVTGEYPVLLLDDVLSELDISRQKRLMSINSQIQTIITCTHIDSALPKMRSQLEIHDGQVDMYDNFERNE